MRDPVAVGADDAVKHEIDGAERMTLARRQLLQLALGASALPVACRLAAAQAYPTRPVSVIVGYGAATSPDIIARLLAHWLSERLGQPFIVENRPGAGSNIATETVARAAPNGYSLLLVTASNAINTTLYDGLNFNFVRDIAPVASIAGTPFVMQVNPSFPATTVPEFIAYAKANPGKVNMASVGNGTAPHVFGEMFKAMAGVDLVHVPYRTNPMSDLLSGHVQVYFAAIPSSIGYIRAGKLRALAVTSAARSALLPDIPALGEFVPGYEASAWQGVGVPKDTPAEIIDRLNKEITAGLADPDLKARIAEQGAVPMPMTPVEFGKFIADETEKWAKVVKFAGVRAE
jgi:tripartite-type tricarboxylate transporter receptor subunit TctC